MFDQMEHLLCKLHFDIVISCNTQKVVLVVVVVVVLLLLLLLLVVVVVLLVLRLVLQRQRLDHITVEMRERLHWLDASARIKYKLCVFAFRCVNGTAPQYLSKLCVPVSTMSGRSRLRSAATGELLVPSCSTKTIGPRAFAVSCPSAWNSLPIELRLPGLSLSMFKRHLKTELFRSMLLL